METIKIKPNQWAYGLTNQGQPFAVALNHVVSVEPNPNADHITFIHLDDGRRIIAQATDGPWALLTHLIPGSTPVPRRACTSGCGAMLVESAHTCHACGAPQKEPA